MKYLCLIYEDETIWQKMSKSESDKFLADYGALTKDIRASGQWLAGDALQPVASATTIRVRNGKTLTTDGPFAETKEQLGGFYLIDAADLNDAIKIAARIPSAKHGSIEVRPIMVMTAG